MTRIALIAAAMLVVTGSAFAGSDHYGSGGADQLAAPVAKADDAFTASVGKPDPARHDVDTKVTTGPAETVQDMIARHNDEGLWGQ